MIVGRAKANSAIRVITLSATPPKVARKNPKDETDDEPDRDRLEHDQNRDARSVEDAAEYVASRVHRYRAGAPRVVRRGRTRGPGSAGPVRRSFPGTARRRPRT